MEVTAQIQRLAYIHTLMVVRDVQEYLDVTDYQS